jgi:hypothetical protein
MATISLPLHSYALRSSQASPSRLVNCYAESLPSDAKVPYLLNRAPAAQAWTTVGTGPIHRQHVAYGYLFVVSGSKLWRVDKNKNATELGSVGNAASPGDIDMDANDTALVVVREPYGYYYDGVTFGQITHTDFVSRGAAEVETLNNRFIFREPNSGRFFSPELGSATVYDALDFATAEGSPDLLTGMKSDHLQLVNFGEESGEIWANDPNAGSYPMARTVNGFFELGCLNGKTVAKLDNSIFWLASDFTVRRLQGVTPVRVSTHAIEQKLTDTTYSTAHAWTYAQDGHLFYVLTFPEGTFVYDATTQLWHERETYGETQWNLGNPVTFAGGVLVGDLTSNKIGRLDPKTYADFGQPQRVEWVYQPIYAEGVKAFHDSLEMVFERGVGLTSGQGSDPQITLEFSDDGGKTWLAMPTRSIGMRGQYGWRVKWSGLGSSAQRVYRGSFSDPTPLTLTDTVAEVRGGRL